LSVAAPLLGLRHDLGLPDSLPVVAVSNRGSVPPTLSGCRDGRVLLAVPASAPGLEAARDDLGTENVLVCGDDRLDLPALLDELHARGLDHVLTEGGPGLLGSFIAADAIDELCYTVVPQVVGDGPPRTVGADGTPADLDLGLLVEQDGTLMGRWFVRR
ncbi:MAG: deaminase, partial [Dermatophilaceae bacterium]|nr:deaminase [Dermatophilaceae bacterium]